LNVLERFRKKPRRRATHNRLFDTIKDLKASVRNTLRYFQTVRTRTAQPARFDTSSLSPAREVL